MSHRKAAREAAVGPGSETFPIPADPLPRSRSHYPSPLFHLPGPSPSPPFSPVAATGDRSPTLHGHDVDQQDVENFYTPRSSDMAFRYSYPVGGDAPVLVAATPRTRSLLDRALSLLSRNSDVMAMITHLSMAGLLNKIMDVQASNTKLLRSGSFDRRYPGLSPSEQPEGGPLEFAMAGLLFRIIQCCLTTDALGELIEKRRLGFLTEEEFMARVDAAHAVTVREYVRICNTLAGLRETSGAPQQTRLQPPSAYQRTETPESVHPGAATSVDDSSMQKESFGWDEAGEKEPAPYCVARLCRICEDLRREEVDRICRSLCTSPTLLAIDVAPPLQDMPMSPAKRPLSHAAATTTAAADVTAARHALQPDMQ